MNEPEKIIGPVLPSEFKVAAAEEEEKSNVSSESDQLYGPLLPPNYQKSVEKAQDRIIGPTLPVNWGNNKDDDDTEDSEDDDVGIGPMPCVSSDTSSTERIARDFERRAEKMKNKLCGIDTKEIKREEWMTDLPTEMAKSFGLGPRTFSRKAPLEPGDRTVWTDTPAEKERKERLRLEGKSVNSDEGNRSKIAIPQKQPAEPEPRRESLVEIHKKNLKRKAEVDNKPKERRPFDRDMDLQANKFDNARRDLLVKRSRELHSKFAPGQTKFL